MDPLSLPVYFTFFYIINSLYREESLSSLCQKLLRLKEISSLLKRTERREEGGENTWQYMNNFSMYRLTWPSKYISNNALASQVTINVIKTQFIRAWVLRRKYLPHIPRIRMIPAVDILSRYRKPKIKHHWKLHFQLPKWFLSFTEHGF